MDKGSMCQIKRIFQASTETTPCSGLSRRLVRNHHVQLVVVTAARSEPRRTTGGCRGGLFETTTHGPRPKSDAKFATASIQCSASASRLGRAQRSCCLGPCPAQLLPWGTIHAGRGGGGSKIIYFQKLFHDGPETDTEPRHVDCKPTPR